MRDSSLPRSNAAVRDLIAASGVPLDDCLSGTGLGREDLAPGSELHLRNELRIIANVRQAAPEHSDLGLDGGSRSRAADFGMIGLLMRSSASFADALFNSVSFQDLCHPLPLSALERSGDELVATMNPEALPAELRPVLIDQQLAVLHAIRLELMEGRETKIRAIELTQPSPPHAERYAELFGIRPRFGARADRLVYAGSEVNEPLAYASPETVPQLQENCRALIRHRHARVGVTGQVLRSLDRQGEPVPSLEQVASDLNVSARTLRRMLSDEGRSFRELSAEVRLSRAAFLLDYTDKPVETISAELGYGAAPAFVHAFRRWTGETPAAFRRMRRTGLLS